MVKIKPASVDEYIDNAPVAATEKLRGIRSILKEVAPDAEEMLKWGQPVFVEKRILFSFVAYKSHLNFMPTGTSLEPFREELKRFKTGKDTIQFTYDKPLPRQLIQKIADHRRRNVLENDAKWMS